MSENPGRLKLETTQPTQAWSAVSASLTEPTAEWEEAVCPEVEDYLDHLTAGLLTLPYNERTALRTEVRQHLQAAVAACEEIGMEHAEAILQTLARFGEPSVLAMEFVSSYQSTGTNRKTFPKAAYRHALALFGGVGL